METILSASWELFAVPSWEEHLRQHRYRQTGVDARFEEEANALSDPAPETSHLISVEPRKAPGS